MIQILIGNEHSKIQEDRSGKFSQICERLDGFKKLWK